MDYNFEEVIEKLLVKQRKTKISLVEAMGMTRQGFNTKIKNKTVFVVELAKMASFFEMSELDLIAELSNKSTVSQINVTPNDEYLREHLNTLEEKFAKLVDQLAVKDHQLESKDIQIAGLQRTVDVLVGKSEGVTEEPLSPYAVTILSMLDQYKTLALGQPKAPVKKVKKRGSKVGGTPFSQAENALVTN